MAKLVTGLFKTRSSAENAVESLIHNGYSREDISLLMSDATRGREFALQMASKAPEGAAAGATIGGAIGAIAAGLVVLGVLVVPGLALGYIGIASQRFHHRQSRVATSGAAAPDGRAARGLTDCDTAAAPTG